MTIKKILIITSYCTKTLKPRYIVGAGICHYIISCGLVPMLCPFFGDIPNLEEVIDILTTDISGLILIGGENYIEKSPSIRDVFEIMMVSKCKELGVPIFGICRGMQIINIEAGGLVQPIDVQKHHHHQQFLEGKPKVQSFDNNDIDYKHSINLRNNLYNTIGKSSIEVNSLHEQQITKIGKNIIIEAESDDGIIEAISSDNCNILGVQFHPELDLTSTYYLKIIGIWISKVNQFISPKLTKTKN